MPDPKYGLDPERGMSDGLLGTDNFGDGMWLGWQGQDVGITLDFGRTQEVRELSIPCLQTVTSWILLPRSVAFQRLDDGERWCSLPKVGHDVSVAPGGQFVHDFRMKQREPIVARYVRASLVSQGKMPGWHLGAGGDSWIFADELVVR